jgi:hypothetical protein
MSDNEFQALMVVPAGRPGTFAKGFDPRRGTLEERIRGVKDMKKRISHRSITAALRERISSEEIADWMIRAAFDGIDPATEYGPDGLPTRSYPPLTFDQRLKVMQIILERRDGMPAQRIVLEEELKRMAAEAEARPDYSALSNEELEAMRSAQRKAIEAGKAKRAAMLGRVEPTQALTSGEDSRISGDDDPKPVVG